MENNNYVTQLFERMYNLSKSGNQGSELLAVLDETREYLQKKIELDNWRNDPNRAKDTFSANYEEQTAPKSESKPAEFEPLQEFGTPEDNSKGFGSM